MFPFRKKKNQDPLSEKKPKKKIWEKVVMGAIVGGAIGSVIGASIAPKKGAETREDLTDIAKNAKKSSKIFFRRFKKMLKFKSDPGKTPEKEALSEEVKKIPNE